MSNYICHAFASMLYLDYLSLLCHNNLATHFNTMKERHFLGKSASLISFIGKCVATSGKRFSVRSRQKERTFLIITFCGHSKIYDGREELQEKVIAAIEEFAKGEEITFYLGGYGSFDIIALFACKEYKERHPDAKILFVSPYLDEAYFRNRENYLKECDGIIYAETENTPRKYAILKRNEWMVKNADYLIAYVNHGWGGAAKSLLYAVKHKKAYRNIGTKTFEED